MSTVILHHGLLGGGFGIGRMRWSSFYGLHRLIAAGGYRVLVSNVHPTAGVHRRALQLRDWFLANRQNLGDGKVILIAHSLGGLDARYLLARLDLPRPIDALLTVSTPHRGSPYADSLVKHLGHRLRGIQLARKLGLDLEAVLDATPERCAQFNAEIHDVPATKYFSISASIARAGVPMFARHAWDRIAAEHGLNDGLVAASSAIWGTHLGHWPVHHWHLVNRRFPSRFPQPIKDISPYYLAATETILDKSLD